MVLDILFVVGRIFVGGFYITSSFNHFFKRKEMAEYAKFKSVPLPNLAVFLTGLLLLFGGASILFGIYPYIGVALISLFLIPVSLMMHNFWSVQKEQKKIEIVNFMKNMALLGSTLMFLKIQMPW